MTPRTPATTNPSTSISNSGASNTGWHYDPFRRHELRFRDGDLWTEHVSDRGIAGVDTTPVATLPRARPPDRTAGVISPPTSPLTPVRVLAETTHTVPTVSVAQILVVEQVTAGVEGPAGIERGLSDEHGNRIGTLRVGRESHASKLLRMLTTRSPRELTELDVFDGNGALVLSLDRPTRFLKPRIIVANADATVGTVVPDRIVTGLRYRLEAEGVVVGAVIGDGPSDREVRVLDHSGTAVARISTTWEVLSASHHPTANSYLVIFERHVPDPLHSLALAAMLALDTMLVPDPAIT